MNKSIFIFIFSFFSQGVYAKTWAAEKDKYKIHDNIGANQHTGQQTADYLNQDYANTVKGCDDDEHLPAFLCSGVMIRGTKYSSAYHSWDPSPSSVDSGGVSFSYLRKDSKYDKLAYGYVNGLIFILYFIRQRIRIAILMYSALFLLMQQQMVVMIKDVGQVQLTQHRV